MAAEPCRDEGYSMDEETRQYNDDPRVPVLALGLAPGERTSWDRSQLLVFAWAAFELIFVTNPWQISSKVRVYILRLFGAKMGRGIIFRPRTRVKFPWKLEIGDDCWIGEGVWFHNQATIHVGHDVVISQDTFLTTGSHAHRKDMGLITRPISIGDGAWITSRCVVLGGTNIGKSALITPLSVANGDIPANHIAGGNPLAIRGKRFEGNVD